MLVAFDVDDTLAKFNIPLLNVYNAIDGTNYTSRDIKSYNLEMLWGCTKEEAIQRIQYFYKTHEFGRIVPVEGSQEAVEKLSKENQLIVITSRLSSVSRKTEEWLDKYFSGKFSDIYYTSEWHSANGGSGKKADICRDKKVDIIIDDCLEYILACQNVGTRGILFDLNGEYGWNKTEEEIKRVLNWEEVLKKIKK
ncbi:hypothetical protein J4438_00490 [Candidatus Woesearchaeota archaeon]|nr:hypothetical protein [Candidatus Woesearchaeota archaeon]